LGLALRLVIESNQRISIPAGRRRPCGFALIRKDNAPFRGGRKRAVQPPFMLAVLSFRRRLE
jgi:hypothetical protein